MPDPGDSVSVRRARPTREALLRSHSAIFCSPVTLFAVLAVIRQAVDNFALEQASNEMLNLMASFQKQWTAYQKAIATLGALCAETERARARAEAAQDLLDDASNAPARNARCSPPTTAWRK